MRGTDPDAALYWLARMLDGGCDPHYLARRITRMAAEDIGLADPRALQLTLDAWQAYERLGSPEGELALAEAVVYLAVAAKSNAVYTAFDEARADVERYGSLEVPLRLRNAPTRADEAARATAAAIATRTMSRKPTRPASATCPTTCRIDAIIIRPRAASSSASARRCERLRALPSADPEKVKS